MTSKNMREPESSQAFYLPELDVLRFFAFFVVFVHHVLPNNSNAYQGKLAPLSTWISNTVTAGSFGVDLFFALSSFLITELLIREYEKTKKLNAFAFYARRALRILPLYYFFVLLTIFVFPYLFDNESLGLPHTIGFLTIFANWTCVFFGYPSSVAAPLWSVAVEEQFYLAFPLLVMLFGVKNLKTLAFCFIGIALISRFLLLFIEPLPLGVWCNTFARLDPIAGGIFLALLFRSGKLKPISATLNRIVLCIFGFGLYVLAVRFFDFAGTNSLFLYPLTALASVLIIWSAISPKLIDVKRYKIIIDLGRISYGLYVFHMLAIKISGLILESLVISQTLFTILRFLLAFCLTVILAIISYNILEKPFLKFKKRFTFIKSRPV
jgi:peptidoglycan/LPS O-acetylase OafA/YrhL